MPWTDAQREHLRGELMKMDGAKHCPLQIYRYVNCISNTNRPSECDELNKDIVRCIQLSK